MQVILICDMINVVASLCLTDHVMRSSPPHPVALPMGALLLAGPMSALAQTPATPSSGTLDTVTVTEQADPAEIQSKSTLRATDTRLGKGQQALRDMPQNVTVMTEQLLDDRNLDNFRDLLKATAGVTFLAGETGEEDVRLRGFSLGQAGDVYRDGLREGQLISRDTFATDRVEVLKGLAAGETYVSEGSFLIKADIGKSGASHDH